MPHDEQVELSPEELALQASLAALEEEEKKTVVEKPKDLAEEYAAEQAAKKEAGAEGDKESTVATDDGATPEAEGAPVVEPPAEANPPSEKQRPKEVDAIVALRKQNQLISEQLAMAQGQVVALSKVALAKSNETEAAPKKDRVEEIRVERQTLADKVDTGDLSVREYEDLRYALEQEELEIKLSALREAKPATVPHQEDLYLAEQTNKLRSDNPFLAGITSAQLKPFEDLAYIEAEMEGKPIQAGAAGTLELRQRMVRLAAKVYDKPVAVDAPVKKVTPEGGAEEKAAQSKALEAKLKMQEQMPPDVTKLGHRGDSAGLTEAQVAAKLFDPATSEEEATALIDSLSPALREKLVVR